HAFDGKDIPLIAFEREDETGKHGLAVEKDGAGAALAEFAAVLGAGVAEIFAKDFEQSFVRGKRDVNLFAVERHSKVRSFLGFGWKRNQHESPLGKLS